MALRAGVLGDILRMCPVILLLRCLIRVDTGQVSQRSYRRSLLTFVLQLDTQDASKLLSVEHVNLGEVSCRQSPCLTVV